MHTGRSWRAKFLKSDHSFLNLQTLIGSFHLKRRTLLGSSLCFNEVSRLSNARKIRLHARLLTHTLTYHHGLSLFQQQLPARFGSDMTINRAFA